jgi:hypothetical protein
MIVQTLRLQFEGVYAVGPWLAIGGEGIQESVDCAVDQQIAPCLRCCVVLCCAVLCFAVVACLLDG